MQSAVVDRCDGEATVKPPRVAAVGGAPQTVVLTVDQSTACPDQGIMVSLPWVMANSIRPAAAMFLVEAPQGPDKTLQVWPPSVDRYTPFGVLPGESFLTPSGSRCSPIAAY